MQILYDYICSYHQKTAKKIPPPSREYKNIATGRGSGGQKNSARKIILVTMTALNIISGVKMGMYGMKNGNKKRLIPGEANPPGLILQV